MQFMDEDQCRMILLMMIVICLNGTILLEQPFGTLFEYYPRWRDFIMKLMEIGGKNAVNRTSWWMMHYGGPTPKRHVAWCNSPNINFLDLGKLRGWAKHKRELEAKGNAPQPLVHKYIDKSGRRRYKGSRSLKSSEIYPPAFGRKLANLWSKLTSEKTGMPPLPERVPPATETFDALSFSDVWQDANMASVCYWLRGGKDLKIPDSFRGLLPKRL